MAPHSSTLAWKIPWMEEPGRLQSMGLLRVGDDWTTSLSLFTFMHWRRKWQPTPVFLPGESQEPGARWAAVYGVAQSRTRLKWLSSGSSSRHLNRIDILGLMSVLSYLWMTDIGCSSFCEISFYIRNRNMFPCTIPVLSFQMSWFDNHVYIWGKKHM